MKVLFHLISGQKLPVYISTKMENPDLNVYLYTAGSFMQVEQIREVIKKKSEITEISAFDFAELTSQFNNLFKQYAADELILDFTGGTKLMALAGFMYFSEKGFKCVYINTEDNKYLSFNGMNIPEITDINCAISLKAYVKLQNNNDIEFENNIKVLFPDSELFDRTSEFLATNFNKFSDVLLDKYAKKYNFEKIQFPIIDLTGSKVQLKYDKGKGLVKFSPDGHNVAFEDEFTGVEYLEFLRGGWFELAVWKELSRLEVLDDLKINVKTSWKNNKNAKYKKNEFDIVGIKGIYPFMFECKSGGVTGEEIEKLSGLKNNYLGRYSTVYLITYYPVTANILEKLKENRIKHCLYSNLQNLKNNLLQDKRNLA